ncbi:iron-containing alcohol dehydrogenase family protein [Martelella alba]|uniref:Iron-containing alcohol dehydrogenase family protein n=1 Tax=Martelella alba TaxID=2590451 RepID=A0ABY2SKP7_9HYPH|nr:iron-containing alcohol dehydrogenase family protein [Martelella alba]TKI04796.1 iron-containing alcohol dehydrogenase family protein [Martelella alba]
MIVVKAPQHYLNETGLLYRIGEYVAPIAREGVMIITSPRAWQTARQAIDNSFGAKRIRYRRYFLQGECTAHTIAAFAGRADADNAALIIGVGGGKVLDTAKGVAESSGRRPLITVPTIAATCAAWSPITVLYSDTGAHLHSMALERTPDWVLVDSAIIAAAPVRYLKAGIVDALAKWFEFEPYLRAKDDSLSLVLKAQAARLALDIIEQHAKDALDANEHGRVTPALLKTVDAVIALAGMANSMRDEFPRIGVAHAIHNSLTRQSDLRGFLHGELVGFGLAVQSRLDDADAPSQLKLLSLLADFSMPVTLAGLGIREERESRAQTLAREVKIPPAVAARLPFPLDAGRIMRAILANDGQPGGAATQAAPPGKSGIIAGADTR